MVHRRGFLFGLAAAVLAACKNRIVGADNPAPQCGPGTAPAAGGATAGFTGLGRGAAGISYLVTRDGQCVPVAAQPQPTAGPTPVAPSVPIGTTPSGNLGGLRVTLDVGHGVSDLGWDPGAQNTSRGLIEYELNREEAFLVAEKLRAKGAQVKVNDYKAGSARLTLSQKGQAAADANIFVSIHHNSASASAQGTEVLHHPQGSNSDRSLAQTIQRNMTKNIWKGSAGSKDRGTKSMRLGVLGGVPKTVKACCLTEAFFLSGSDANKATTSEWVKAAAQGVTDGIEEFWSNKSLSLYDSVDEWPAQPFPEDADPEGMYEGH